MHSLDELLDVSALRLGARQAFVVSPSVPFLLLFAQLVGRHVRLVRGYWTVGDGEHVTFHGLFV